MRKKATPEKSANEWLSVVMGSLGSSGEEDVVPEGWLHVPQMAELMKLPVSTMTHRIKRLMAEGKLQKKSFRIRCGRHTTEVAHYKGK
jgi:hypothetical protein